MRRKYGFWTTIVGLLLVTAFSVYAQANSACPTLVQESYTATGFLCESVPDGQACIGNGVVNITPVDGATVQFANPGELAVLAQIQRLQVQTLNTDTQAWTSVTAKLDASTRDGEQSIMDMLIFGDAVVTNAAIADTATASGGIFPATIQAGGGVIVRQDSRVDSNNIWQLTNGESVQAIGRSADNQWVRILIPSPNGGAGWVFGQFIEVTAGREVLPFHTNASSVPETSSAGDELTYKPMQAFRLESLLTDTSCAETTDSGVLLQSPSTDTRSIVEVNGVELRLRGTVFMTAQVGDKMTIYNLEGETAVIVGESRVDLTLATMTEIPMDASLAPTSAPSDATPYTQETADLLVFLPIRLLSRNFEISFVGEGVADAGTDTQQPSEQSAPPPPAATQAPPEESAPVEQPENCPTLVQESYTATEFLCESLSPNSACLGNAGSGMVLAIQREGLDAITFASPGDIVTSTDIQNLTTRVLDEPTNMWTSTVMTVDMKTSTGQIVPATMLVFGEVILDNQGQDPNVNETNVEAPPQPAVPPPPAAADTSTAETAPTTDGTVGTIQAPGGIIVRAQPRVDTETVGQLQDGDPVTALGRSVDQQWVQIASDSGITGWVFIQFVTIEGGADALPIIDPAAQPANNAAPPPPPATSNTAPPPPSTAGTGEVPEYTSMQAFDFSSIDIDRDCQDSTDSGIMIQSPDDMDGVMLMLINGVEVQLNGTIFTRSETNVSIDFTVLEGEVVITAMGESQTVMEGERSSVQLGNGFEPTTPPNPPAEYSYNYGSRLPFLPIRLMPRNFEPIVPPEPAGNNVVDSGSSNDTSSSNNTSNSDVVNVGGTTVDFNAECEISAGDRARNLRADAGSGFDVINVLQPGQTIVGVSQKRGADGFYWYETSRGWIRFDAGVTTPDCEILPLYGVIYDTSGTGTGGNTASVAPVAPPAPPQPTSPPPPPATSEVFGNVCNGGGSSYSAEIEQSGLPYYEFGGVWTGQAGQSVTFSADIPYYRAELVNIITFVNEDGSPWLGSIDSNVFTINFDSTRRFRVRVAGLLGDFITLRVSC